MGDVGARPGVGHGWDVVRSIAPLHPRFREAVPKLSEEMRPLQRGCSSDVPPPPHRSDSVLLEVREVSETSPNLSKGIKEKGEEKSSAVNLGFFPPLEAFA